MSSNNNYNSNPNPSNTNNNYYHQIIDSQSIIDMDEINFFMHPPKENQQPPNTINTSMNNNNNNEEENEEQLFTTNNNNNENDNDPLTQPLNNNPSQEDNFFFINNTTNTNSNNHFDTTIEEIYFNISSIIANEKSKLQSEKEHLLKVKKEFKERKAYEMTRIEKEKNKLKQKFKLSNNAKENDIIDLNIGGTNDITTSRSTLIKFTNSALAILFSGHNDLAKRNDKIFIDRDAEPFINMINYLRSGKFQVLKTINDEIKFFDELEYWKIPVYESKTNNARFIFDSEWCASSLSLDISTKTIVKKLNNPSNFIPIDLQHGIVFCKPTLDSYSVYLEFKVSMSKYISKGRSYLLIGLVDKSTFKYDHLTSKYLRDAPTCYCWDIWNSVLIKTDEYGNQIGNIKGYGCLCDSNESRIGMKYDHKARSVSFYKNGICFGVAFRNVPTGLTPCLDICYESGTVEIIKNAFYQEKSYL